MCITPVKLNLSSYFLNRRRITDLLNKDELRNELIKIDGTNDFFEEYLINTTFKDCLLKYLNERKTPTLEQLLYKGELETGKVFTCHRDYYCKDLVGVTTIENVNESSPIAQVYSNLKEFNNKKLIVLYRPIHLITNSSWVKLTGHQNLMVIGIVDKIDGNNIVAIPLAIADVTYEDLNYVSQKHIFSSGEIHIDDIDSFKLVKGEPIPKKIDLELLKDIPENDVKIAIAEIINERTIPKDWGGEKSDLFSTNVKLNGDRVSTAFLLKGPSAFHPMMPKDLGKNGDQIVRLFEEPATLLVLQHCHEIMPPVRSMMKAYASQTGKLRLFCVINGYDTLRILKAYSQCGL